MPARRAPGVLCSVCFETLETALDSVASGAGRFLSSCFFAGGGNDAEDEEELDEESLESLESLDELDELDADFLDFLSDVEDDLEGADVVAFVLALDLATGASDSESESDELLSEL